MQTWLVFAPSHPSLTLTRLAGSFSTITYSSLLWAAGLTLSLGLALAEFIAFFAFTMYSVSPANMRMQGISDPPCEMSWEYCLLPVTLHCIVPPHLINKEQIAEYFLGTWPDNISSFFHCYSKWIKRISRLPGTIQYFSMITLPCIFVNLVAPYNGTAKISFCTLVTEALVYRCIAWALFSGHETILQHL